MIATGQYAFSARLAAVDPHILLAIAPIPTEPRHTMEAFRDSLIRAVSGEPHRMSVSILTGFPSRLHGSGRGAHGDDSA
jgi:hypothetical protein